MTPSTRVFTVIALSIFLAACAPAITIPDNARGIYFDSNGNGQLLLSGTQTLPPDVVEKDIHIFSLAVQTYTMSVDSPTGMDSIDAPSSDGHELFIDTALVYKFNPDKLIEIALTWRDPEPVLIAFIRPTARNIIFHTMSVHTFNDITKDHQSDIEAEIRQQLSNQFRSEGIDLVDFKIMKVTSPQ